MTFVQISALKAFVILCLVLFYGADEVLLIETGSPIYCRFFF